MNVHFELNWTELIVALIAVVLPAWSLIKSSRVEKSNADIKASAANVQGWTAVVDDLRETVNFQKTEMSQMREHHHADVLELRGKIDTLSRDHQQCMDRDNQKANEIVGLKAELDKLRQQIIGSK